MAPETDTAAAEPEREGVEQPAAPFWTRRVYAAAAVLFLLRSPELLEYSTTAGLVGGAFGMVAGGLVVAGLGKKAWQLLKR